MGKGGAQDKRARRSGKTKVERKRKRGVPHGKYSDKPVLNQQRDRKPVATPSRVAGGKK